MSTFSCAISHTHTLPSAPREWALAIRHVKIRLNISQIISRYHKIICYCTLSKISTLAAQFAINRSRERIFLHRCWCPRPNLSPIDNHFLALPHNRSQIPLLTSPLKRPTNTTKIKRLPIRQRRGHILILPHPKPLQNTQTTNTTPTATTSLTHNTRHHITTLRMSPIQQIMRIHIHMLKTTPLITPTARFITLQQGICNSYGHTNSM
mmetsp:Transcript_3998/g.4425  ORF Transcript_3998/g.4425 Transcript_3998/m.4425 type:complete len:208 (-) Transcript_3998:767-1390(-)